MAGNDLNFRNLSSVVNNLILNMQGLKEHAENIETNKYISAGEVIESDSIDNSIIESESGNRLLTENGEYLIFE